MLNIKKKSQIARKTRKMKKTGINWPRVDYQIAKSRFGKKIEQKKFAISSKSDCIKMFCPEWFAKKFISNYAKIFNQEWFAKELTIECAKVIDQKEIAKWLAKYLPIE